MKKRELKEQIAALERMLHTAADDVVEARDRANRWEAAWREGDKLRTKLMDRIHELTKARRAETAELQRAKAVLREAELKLGNVGWLHAELDATIPHWQRKFAAYAGNAWDRGETTAPQQLRWALDYLRRPSA